MTCLEHKKCGQTACEAKYLVKMYLKELYCLGPDGELDPEKVAMWEADMTAEREQSDDNDGAREVEGYGGEGPEVEGNGTSRKPISHVPIAIPPIFLVPGESTPSYPMEGFVETLYSKYVNSRIGGVPPEEVVFAPGEHELCCTNVSSHTSCRHRALVYDYEFGFDNCAVISVACSTCQRTTYPDLGNFGLFYFANDKNNVARVFSHRVMDMLTQQMTRAPMAFNAYRSIMKALYAAKKSPIPICGASFFTLFFIDQPHQSNHTACSHAFNFKEAQLIGIPELHNVNDVAQEQGNSVLKKIRPSVLTMGGPRVEAYLKLHVEIANRIRIQNRREKKKKMIRVW